ncbi:hypothetical protein ABZS66_07415 [Dactylosporangium sp. NPDC005572]|uniref:hypothetical protein n=1 Tax=Dactylosporangium sp. NPDC005572 TaxID=3156889 RepID=UPI0033A9A747
MRVTFDDVATLAAALKDAERAHGAHEAQLGHRDEDWPSWYAEYILKTYGQDE